MNKQNIIIFLLNKKVINAFFVNHVKFLGQKYNIIFISSEKNKSISINNKKYKNYFISIKRNLNIFTLIFNIYDLWKILKFNKIYCILSVHPKIGLISSIGSYFTDTKSVHIFTGQIWSIKKRNNFIFKLVDNIIFNYCDYLLADSKNQINFLINNGFTKKKISLLHNGSIRGVPKKTIFNPKIKEKFFKKFNIPKSSKIILYSGRINFDKGINTLIQSFELLQKKNINNLYLLIVGDDEIDIAHYLKSFNQSVVNKVIRLPYTDKIFNYYSVSDIFCLPSLREGFGMSVIEASLHSLPVVVSNIYGLSDSYINGHTGFNFKVSDEADLTKKLLRLLKSDDARINIGNNGRKFVTKKYFEDDISKYLLNYIDKLS